MQGSRVPASPLQTAQIEGKQRARQVLRRVETWAESAKVDSGKPPGEQTKERTRARMLTAGFPAMARTGRMAVARSNVALNLSAIRETDAYDWP